MSCLNKEFKKKFLECWKWIDENRSKLPPSFQYSPLEALASLGLYTMNFYQDLNKELRNIDYPEIWIEQVEKMRPYLNAAQWGLKQLEFHWGIVHRYISQKGGIKQGEIIRFPDFLSCSKKKEVCLGFKETKDEIGTLFIILSQTGRYIKPISFYPDEEEVLLFPGTTFKVLKVESNKNSDDVIDLEEIVLPFGEKKILWIDDSPENNQELMEEQEKKGISVFWRKNTNEKKRTNSLGRKIGFGPRF